MTKSTIGKKTWKTIKMDKVTRKMLFGIFIKPERVKTQIVYTPEELELQRLAEVEKELKIK